MAASKTYTGNNLLVTLADPKNITRDECLLLAEAGVQTWNAWRVEYPARCLEGKWHNNADFSGRTFASTGSPNFSSFTFGGGATFEGSTFQCHANFTDARFASNVSFVSARFEHGATFDHSQFQFSDCTSNFSHAKFAGASSFQNTNFNGSSNFRGASFGGKAIFKATFSSNADFSSTVFSDAAEFGTQFSGDTSFQEATFKSGTKFSGTFVGRADFSRSAFQRDVSFKSGRFGPLDFSGTKFDADAIFDSATFNASTVFDTPSSDQGAMFAVPPSFHDATFPQNFDFGSSKFPGIKGKLSSAHAYRTLKLAFAQQHAVREELRFFKLEMAEESKTTRAHKTPNWWLYWLYEKLSDFGFSINRPLLLFAFTTGASVILYAHQADLTLCWPWSPTCNATAPLLQFGFAHALPGFEKLAEPAAIKLFGDATGKGIADLGLFTVITLFAQKTVSLLSLFLIGLALRNLFKMK